MICRRQRPRNATNRPRFGTGHEAEVAQPPTSIPSLRISVAASVAARCSAKGRGQARPTPSGDSVCRLDAARMRRWRASDRLGEEETTAGRRVRCRAAGHQPARLSRRDRPDPRAQVRHPSPVRRDSRARKRRRTCRWTRRSRIASTAALTFSRVASQSVSTIALSAGRIRQGERGCPLATGQPRARTLDRLCGNCSPAARQRRP